MEAAETEGRESRHSVGLPCGVLRSSQFNDAEAAAVSPNVRHRWQRQTPSLICGRCEVSAAMLPRPPGPVVRWRKTPADRPSVSS